MGRRNLSPQDRERLSNPIFWEWRQALYTHPGGYTTETLAWADKSARYIGIPPVANTDGPVAGFAGTTTAVLEKPAALQLFRANDFFVSLDRVPDTQHGAFVPANTWVTVLLNPGVNTLGFTATTGTDVLRVNFGYGH